MNGSDKHHMGVIEADDGGYVMCFGCKATGEGFNYRPPGQCPTPWFDRQDLIDLLRDIELTMDAQPDAVSLGYDIECRMAHVLRRK